MTSSDFGQRHGVAPDPEPVPEDQVPGWVRSQIQKTLLRFAEDRERQYKVELFSSDLYSLIEPLIWKVLDRQPPNSPMGGPWAFYIPRVINECAGWQLYALLEDIYVLISRKYSLEDAKSFSSSINYIFETEAISWRFADGKIERRLPEPIEQAIESTRVLLRNSRFHGPDEQFEKARDHLNHRPEPDTENCVKDSIGALEGVVNIVAGTAGKTLGQLINGEPFRSAIHGALRGAIDKLYGYRSDASGVAHAQQGPTEVGLEEAEFVLGSVASAIVYLAKKFPG